MKRLLLAVVACACLFGVASGGEAKKATKDAEVRIVGEIVANDVPDKVRKHPCKIHTLKLSRDQVYIIDMESTDFDCYLRLEDAAGKQLAFDDDGGDKLNSRLRFTPPKDDNYQIIATTFGGGVGTYTLKVCAEGPAPKVLAVKLEDGQGQVAGGLALTDPKDRVRQNPCKTYAVELTQGRTYIIDLLSGEFDPYLRLEDPKGDELARDDDGGGFPNARIRIAAPTTGAHRICVTSFGGGVGAYTLKVRAEGEGKDVPAKGALPAAADGRVHAAAGLKIDGKLTADNPKDRVRLVSTAKVYRVKMTANKTYTIDMHSEEFDTYLRLEDDNGKQLAFDDDGGDELNARLTYRATVSGTFRVIATSFSGGTGAFQLKFREE